MAEPALITNDTIEGTILRLRGQNVMLDTALAALYGVAVKALNQAVKRNRDRFPPDFMFRLTAAEADVLRSQSVTAKSGRGGRRTAPYAFTEQGVAMLSSVLRSSRAVRVNIEIMRAFVRLRQLLQSNGELSKKLDQLEARYDAQFKAVFQAIRELMAPPASPRPKIGFRAARWIISTERPRRRRAPGDAGLGDSTSGSDRHLARPKPRHRW